MGKIYLYDNSFDGLLTAIFDSFESRERPENIKPERTYQQQLFEEAVRVETDYEKSGRVSDGIKTKISNEVLGCVYKAFLSENKDHGMIIYDYLKYAFKVGGSVNERYAEPRVMKLLELNKRVGGEAHRMLGFVRFASLKDDHHENDYISYESNGRDEIIFSDTEEIAVSGAGVMSENDAEEILYSEIEPDYNIIGLIMPHFCDRMPEQKFIIGDVKRNIYGVGNKGEMHFTDHVPEELKTRKTSGEYELLWKEFFRAISIKERESARRQMQHMPKKYWKHITEKI